MQLYLVRHGQSTGNLGGRILGQAMAPELTSRGRAQAATAARGLRDCGIKVIWSSDQVRAKQTAEIIAEKIGLEVNLVSALREQNWGFLEGKLPSELVEEPTPPGKHITEVAWGGGESVADVANRVRTFMPILAAGPAPALIVGHADSLRVLLTLLSGRGHREVDWVHFAHAQIVPFDWQPK
uniref:histidine phosphatase family protein n=1 Tax=Vaginimicrobium propionicum TaxID=1871034 RepID=UPI0009704DEB|nr:histidine phosphatase family protein [Vaginimicrobium propionicum]